jgi:hypothetical protein
MAGTGTVDEEANVAGTGNADGEANISRTSFVVSFAMWSGMNTTCELPVGGPDRGDALMEAAEVELVVAAALAVALAVALADALAAAAGGERRTPCEFKS